MVGVIIQLALFLVPLIICGLIIGGIMERKHLRRLAEHENTTSDFLVTQLKSFPMGDGTGTPQMVTSEVVIASDYLKSFLSKWRNVFGGEMKSFQRMQQRAKREAILRLVEQAQSQGYNAICNVRISGADIGGNAFKGRRGTPMAAVIASATAYRAQL